jgi:hypothetical protein
MNNITTIMHKATITQDICGSPQCGATSTNSSLLYYLLSIFLHAQSPKTPLRIGQDIYVHLARSSFPELGHNTKPYYTVCTQASYNHFHLALQVLTHSMHKASSSTLSRFYQVSLLTSPRFLFIH